MPRSRSRSPGKGKGKGKGDVSGMAKEGNSESDIVNVAIKQLPEKIRHRLEKLFSEGLLKENDLDLRSITVFASLNEGLQDRVMTHMESERIYVANARSKSGFLIATCDKAKTGCLDARGLGAIDPWRSALVAMATPKQKMIDLEPERDWLDKYGTDTIKLHVNIGALEKEVGMARVTVELPLNETGEAVKGKLSSMGIESVAVNKMKLHNDTVGFLKDRYTLAFYNLLDGAEIDLSVRKRAGVKFRKDHAVPLKRPKTQERQAAAEAKKTEAAAAAKAGATGLAGLPSLPGLGSMGAPKSGLPAGFPGLPGMPGAGLAGLAGMPKFPSLAGLAGAPMPKLGMPGMPGMPGLDSAAMSKGGMPPPGGMPNFAAFAKLPGMPDLSALLAKAGGPAP